MLKALAASGRMRATSGAVERLGNVSRRPPFPGLERDLSRACVEPPAADELGVQAGGELRDRDLEQRPGRAAGDRLTAERHHQAADVLGSRLALLRRLALATEVVEHHEDADVGAVVVAQRAHLGVAGIDRSVLAAPQPGDLERASAGVLLGPLGLHRREHSAAGGGDLRARRDPEVLDTGADRLARRVAGDRGGGPVPDADPARRPHHVDARLERVEDAGAQRQLALALLFLGDVVDEDDVAAGDDLRSRRVLEHADLAGAGPDREPRVLPPLHLEPAAAPLEIRAGPGDEVEHRHPGELLRGITHLPGVGAVDDEDLQLVVEDGRALGEVPEQLLEGRPDRVIRPKRRSRQSPESFLAHVHPTGYPTRSVSHPYPIRVEPVAAPLSAC